VHVVALAGGVGAARFLRGLVRAVDPTRLTVVANTGDDLCIHGLHVSPDLDTITYTLGGGVHPDQGWGRADETFAVQGELRDRYGRPAWFGLGDRDLATHLVRTEVLAGGGTLSEATAGIAAAWGLPFTLRPMADEPVTTTIETADGRRLHFQEWWVGERAVPDVAAVVLEGIEVARPAPGVADALAAADLVVLCPSNPVVSIGPILALPGLRPLLRDVPVVGVSPIVGGAVVRGMADRLLPAVGSRTAADAVAELYADVLDGWVLDHADAHLAGRLRERGLQVAVTASVMADLDVATALARTAVGLLDPGDRP
jgi:LPPG:FO 2-phospho-L-lactate transferase